MSLESKLHDCIYRDDISGFNRILFENDLSIVTQAILNKLSTIAQFGSINIFNKVFALHDVANYFENSEKSRNFVSMVLRHSGLDLINRTFEIQLFRDEVINDPYLMLISSATNINFAPQAFAKIQEVINIDEYIEINYEQIWLTAHVNYNYSAKNWLLEFPEIYAKVDTMHPNSRGPDYINTHFMKYYFAKLPQRDLTAKETKLAYLVLQTLIKTYPDRNEIRDRNKSIERFEEDSRNSKTLIFKVTRAAKNLREKYMPNTEDIHAQRIGMLMDIPAVNRMARDNILTVTVENEANRLLARAKLR